jgi:nicotinamide riboside kinase
MRISISGSQCTGKTTLLNALLDKSLYTADIFNGYYFNLNSKTREVADYNLGHSQEANEYTQIIILSNMIKDALLDSPNMITDRCILDNLVYSRYLVQVGLISKELFSIIENTTDDLIKTYDYVFVLPTNIPLISDGYRDIDYNYRNDINEIFSYYQKYYLIKNRNEKKGKVINVSGQSVEERMEFIKKYINEN